MRDKLTALGLVFILSALVVSGFGVAPVHARGMDAYIVQPGDTLIGIAARHDVSVSQLARANGLRWNSWVYVGQRLVLPDSDTFYTVQRGDTISSLARHFGTSSEAIMQANGLTSTRIYVGQRLIIPTSDTVHTVQWGDTLSRLARRLGTTVEAIMAANNLHSARILVGQRLVMPGNQSAAHPSLAISPTSGPSGSVVEVTASGFPSHASISMGLGPQNSEFGEVARGTTDSNGRFTAEVSVEGAAGMNWVFGANAGDAHATSVPFQITESIPTVAISPTSGPTGTLVQVIGSGFPSHTSVSVGVGPEGSEFAEIAPGVTDASGRFTMNVRVQGAPGMGLVLAAAAERQPGVRSHDVFRITN